MNDDSLKSKFLDLYVNFLKVTSAVEDLPNFQRMNPNEKVLFELIFLHWHDKTPLTVTKTMSLSELGSSATIHTRISKLKKYGYIDLLEHPNDKRVKILTPTEKGLKYIQSIADNIYSSDHENTKNQ